MVKLILEVGGKTNSLDDKPAFKLNPGDHVQYVGEILEELEAYAGNTLCNAFRKLMNKPGVSYKEALGDVLGKFDIAFDEQEEVPDLEEKLLKIGLESYKKGLSPEAWDSFARVLYSVETGVQNNWGPTGSCENGLLLKTSVCSGLPVLAAVVAHVSTGLVAGTTVSAGATIAAGAAATAGATVAHFAIGSAAGAALTTGTSAVGVVAASFFSFLTLPVAVASAFFLGAPAMRVIVPAVIYIAFLRKVRQVHCKKVCCRRSAD